MRCRVAVGTCATECTFACGARRTRRRELTRPLLGTDCRKCMLWARSWPGVVTACCVLRRVPLCVAAQRVVCCAPAVRCTNVAPLLHAARPTPRAGTACCNALRRTLRAVAGLELTRVTVVDANGAALLNELVLPHDPILDYNTRCVSRTPRSLGVPLGYPCTRVQQPGAVWSVLQGHDSSGTPACPGCGCPAVRCADSRGLGPVRRARSL